MDLVRVLEGYCSDNDLDFMYGSKSHLNLIESNLNSSKVHLLLFPVKRNNKQGKLGLNIQETLFTGSFFLVVNSNKDLHYFNEKSQSESTSKYTVNIEPLITQHTLIGNALLSCGYELDLLVWECIDAIDVLDGNLDGIWCNFQIKQYV